MFQMRNTKIELLSNWKVFFKVSHDIQISLQPTTREHIEKAISDHYLGKSNR